MRKIQLICKKMEESVIKLSKAWVFTLSYWVFSLSFEFFTPSGFFKKSNFKAWFTSTATSKNLSDIVGVFGKEPYAFSKVEMKDGTVNEIVVYMHFIEVSQNDRVDDSTDDTGLSIEVVILIITNIVTFLISVIGIPVLWFYFKR